jgi:hypothetical protein
VIVTQIMPYGGRFGAEKALAPLDALSLPKGPHDNPEHR